jgi:hypothetical protein
VYVQETGIMYVQNLAAFHAIVILCMRFYQSFL